MHPALRRVTFVVAPEVGQALTDARLLACFGGDLAMPLDSTQEHDLARDEIAFRQDKEIDDVLNVFEFSIPTNRLSIDQLLHLSPAVPSG